MGMFALMLPRNPALGILRMPGLDGRGAFRLVAMAISGPARSCPRVFYVVYGVVQGDDDSIDDSIKSRAGGLGVPPVKADRDRRRGYTLNAGLVGLRSGGCRLAIPLSGSVKKQSVTLTRARLKRHLGHTLPPSPLKSQRTPWEKKRDWHPEGSITATIGKKKKPDLIPGRVDVPALSLIDWRSL